jgi:hypothetical protein
MPECQYHAGGASCAQSIMEQSGILIAALPVSLILVIGSAWWIFRR